MVTEGKRRIKQWEKETEDETQKAKPESLKLRPSSQQMLKDKSKEMDLALKRGLQINDNKRKTDEGSRIEKEEKQDMKYQLEREKAEKDSGIKSLKQNEETAEWMETTPVTRAGGYQSDEEMETKETEEIIPPWRKSLGQ